MLVTSVLIASSAVCWALSLMLVRSRIVAKPRRRKAIGFKLFCKAGRCLRRPVEPATPQRPIGPREVAVVGPLTASCGTANGQSWRDNASLITRISCSAPNGLKSGFAPASITPSARLSWPVMRITGTVGYASRSVSAS